MLNLNWLAVATLAVFFICCLRGYRRGFVKEVVSAFFVILALALVWLVNPYVNQFLLERTPVYEALENTCREALAGQILDENAERTEQGEYIQDLPLPSFLKESIAENNNSEVYQFLAVDTFSEYIAGYLARILISGISFLVSYLLATILIRVVIFGLDFLTKIPVLHGINAFAGIFVGALRGLVFIWIAFLVITICWNTSWGKACIQMINENPLLSVLYEKDIFVDVFMSIFYGSIS